MKKILMLVLLVLGFAIQANAKSAPFSVINADEPDRVKACKILEEDIKEYIEKASYCESDGNCSKAIQLCPFGCNFSVNNYHLYHVEEAITSYHNLCENYCEYKCAIATEVICKNNKCVPKE